MKYTSNLQLIELEDDNFHMIVPAVFNGGETGYWIVDTGASKSVFDLNLKDLYEPAGEETDQIHTAGIGEKPIHTSIGVLQSFFLGKFLVENLRVALLDLSHINQFYTQAASMNICGLLGGDFLRKYNAVVDYRKKTMRLSTKH